MKDKHMIGQTYDRQLYDITNTGYDKKMIGQ